MAPDAKDDASSELERKLAALTPEQREKSAASLQRIGEALLRAAWHADRLEKAFAIMLEAREAVKH